MNILFRKCLIVFILVAFLLAVPSPVLAQTPKGDQVVVGDAFSLSSDETLNGNLIILGGVGNLAQGSTVTGDVMVTGGAINIQGKVSGSINTIGTAITLGDHAVVEGDINYIGGALVRSEGSQVKGTISTSSPEMLRLPFNLNTNPMQPKTLIDFEPIGNFLWAVFQILALSFLAMLVVLLLPKPVNRLASTITTRTLPATGMGLLTLVIAPAFLLLLIITILLIPLSLIGMLMLMVAIVYGWIAFGLVIGVRITKLLKANWAEPISAGLGTLLISVIAMIPCLGWTAAFLAAILGLGSVVMTRFGTVENTTPQAVSTPPAPSSEPAPSNEGTPTDLLPPVA